MADFSSVSRSDNKEEEFKTGSVRDSRVGKGRYDLISPFAMARLAMHFENGATRYGVRNWELGQPLSRYWDSAIRHLHKYMQNKMLGIQQPEDHLAAAMWNVHCILHTEEMIEKGLLDAKLDDFPIYKNNSNKESIKIHGKFIKIDD